MEPGARDPDELRFEALSAYGILDTPPEPEYDQITRLVSKVCDVPIAVVNFIARDRQFFKSEVGLGVRSTPLETSFCRHALLEHDLLLVPDATHDPRFACNPLVTEDPKLRFYAGALLRSPEGVPVGTLCVLDTRARMLDERQIGILMALRDHVSSLLALRRARQREQQLVAELESQVKNYRALVGNVSHELRTPLQVVSLSASMLREDLGASVQEQFLARIGRAADQMRRLVDDLLDHQAVESGQMSLEPEPFCAQTLLGELVAQMRPVAREAGVELEGASAGGAGEVVADVARTRQILTNLVGNAVKYAGRGARVEVSAHVHADRVRFQVRDDGPGIPRDQLERIFLPFRRVEGVKAPGVGLGLAISRKLAALQNGQLGAESALGEGSTFWLDLPRADA